MMDLEQCRLDSEKRWSNMSVEIQKLKCKQDELAHELNKQAEIVQDIQQLSVSISVLANNMEGMLKEQRRQSERLQALEMKPAKRWDSILDKALMVIVAALVGALLIKLGLPA